MKNKSILLFIAILVISCAKKKPPEGEYLAVFKYENPSTKQDETVWYKIKESNNDYILIVATDYNGNLLYGMDTLYKKDKKKIEGKVPTYNPFHTYEIKG